MGEKNKRVDNPDPSNQAQSAGENIEMNDNIDEDSEPPRQSIHKAHSVKSSEGSKKFEVKIPSAKSSQKATLQKGLLDHDDPNIVQRLNTDIIAKEEAYNNYGSE